MRRRARHPDPRRACIRRQRQRRACRPTSPSRTAASRRSARASTSAAAKTIDAAGLAVAPGFIDIKTHSDFTLPINPKAESKVRQGVTTEIIGHCGFSVAPALPGKVELLRDYLRPSAPWTPFRELTLPAIISTRFPATSVNAGMLVGHNTLRLMVMGMADRAPTKPELDSHDRAARSRASTPARSACRSGLFTPPGSYAEPDEMEAFGHVLKRHNAGYFTHLRDESDKVLDAVQEAIDIADNMPRPCRDRAFQMLGHQQLGQGATRADDDRRRQGARPRRRLRRLPLCRGLQSAEEPAAAVGAVRRRAGDARAAEAARDARAKSAPTSSATASTTGAASRPGTACRSRSRRNLPQFAGRTIASLARPSAAQDPIDTLCDYLVDDQGATRVLVTSISEDDIEHIVASPMALVGSDGNCVAPYGTGRQGHAASALLRHLPAHHPSLRARARRAAAWSLRSTR